jgi:hypothetical protein
MIPIWVRLAISVSIRSREIKGPGYEANISLHSEGGDSARGDHAGLQGLQNKLASGIGIESTISPPGLSGVE